MAPFVRLPTTLSLSLSLSLVLLHSIRFFVRSFFFPRRLFLSFVRSFVGSFLRLCVRRERRRPLQGRRSCRSIKPLDRCGNFSQTTSLSLSFSLSLPLSLCLSVSLVISLLLSRVSFFLHRIGNSSLCRDGIFETPPRWPSWDASEAFLICLSEREKPSIQVDQRASRFDGRFEHGEAEGRVRKKRKITTEPVAYERVSFT